MSILLIFINKTIVFKGLESFINGTCVITNMSKFSVVEYEPTEIIKISISDLTVPMNTAIELQKLALMEKAVLVELFKSAEIDEDSGKPIMHPETLYWAKELRMTIKDIDAMTKGVQEKAMLKKMDIVGDLYKEILKKSTSQDLVKFIKKLERNDTSEIIASD